MEQASPVVAKKLYPYQESAIDTVFEKIEQQPQQFRLLYQLPTGGGKTVVFSEITRRFIEKFNLKVAVLTHRNELCSQTSNTLKSIGVKNKIINSTVKRLPRNNSFNCYVAMVETLKNRIKGHQLHIDNIGLVIIDEAHHNSFRKLLGNFKNAFVIGVTATPFSADISLPMHKTYDELLLGKDIRSLIEQGFLAKPKTIVYDVELNSLKKGWHGDFTVSTSNELYSSGAMMQQLMQSYEMHSKNKKTLIFNNGIATSKKVADMFSAAGFPIKHLDNKTTAAERKEILSWFKKTKNGILTSVSILTTGFDEPTVQSVILNRATTSLTLYHQMIGRGARKLANKKTFTIIDLGNNTERFGEWHDPVDWQHVFEKPEEFYASLSSGDGSQSVQNHGISSELRSKFQKSLEIAFDIETAYKEALEKHQKPKTVIQNAIRQHAEICIANSDTLSEAIHLAKELEPEINWRVKQYAQCLENTTKSYRDWLAEDYKSRLATLISKVFAKTKIAMAG